MNKVYIGSRTLTQNGHKALERLKKAGLELIFGPKGDRPSENDLLQGLPGCIAYLAGTERISKQVLNSAKDLRIISRNGVGIDNIDIKVAESLGIKVTITPGSNAQGVAELAISLLLCSARYIPEQNYELKKGEWNRKKGIEIHSKTLGVIGCGNIGKKVIKMALGLGMKVLGYDLILDDTFNPSNNFKYVDLPVLLRSSDFISLHIPPANKPIIDEAALKKMKDGVYIINTARAEVIDEEAVLKALNKRKIKYYATDVYKEEPPVMDALIKHPNTICTPHIGAFTEESVDRAVESAIDNILKELGVYE